MTSVKTIKDVDDETWSHFKSLAAKNQMKMGYFFKAIVSDYETRARDVWDDILGGEKTITDREAREMKLEIKKMRKESWFRV